MSVVTLPQAPPFTAAPPTAPAATLTMPYALVNGQPVTIVDDQPCVIATSVGQRSTCTFNVLDLPGLQNFRQNQSVQVFDESLLRFSGFIESVVLTKPGWSATLEWQFSCKDNGWLVDKRVDSQPVLYVNKTCLFIVQDMVTKYLASEGVTLVSTVSGPTLTEKTYAYMQLSKVFDDLAQLAGFIWWIDDQRRLFFQSATTTPAPFVLDGTQIEQFANPPAVTNNSGLYRNSQWLTNIPDVTAQQVETRKGDGTTRAFTLSYPLNNVPTISVNSVAKTVGIKGIDDVTHSKNWYWSKGDAVLAQETNDAVLLATDTLSVTYIGQWLSTVFVQDAAQVTVEQNLEGGGTGIVEEASHDATLVTTTQGFQAASAMIARYSKQGNTLTFRTKTSGLVRGQALTVALPAPVGTVANGTYLVEAVTLTRILGDWWYDVQATIGPANVGWVQYFLKLSVPPVIDTSASGVSQQISILQSGAFAWTWTVTGTTTVVTTQFPDNALFPSNTLFPGTAGTPVAITWIKPNVGLNALRDALGGNGPVPAVKYVAWGTGAQGTPQTATQLAAEVGRKQITSAVAGAGVGEEVITGIIGPQDSAGVTLGEVGFFGGTGATGTANSGVLLLYGLYSHAHVASESVQVTADGTVS